VRAGKGGPGRGISQAARHRWRRSNRRCACTLCSWPTLEKLDKDENEGVSCHDIANYIQEVSMQGFYDTAATCAREREREREQEAGPGGI
jgi:hypothetical protein